MNSTSDLTTLVRALPPELFNKIEKETFNFNMTATTCKVDSSYKPPNFLQVTRANRTAFAQAYYSTTAFDFTDAEQGIKWLESLPASHRHVLVRVRVIPCNDKPCSNKLRRRLRSMKVVLLEKTVETDPGKHEVECYFAFHGSPKRDQLAQYLKQKWGIRHLEI